MKKQQLFLSLVLILISVGMSACSKDMATQAAQGTTPPPIQQDNQTPTQPTPPAPQDLQCALRDDQSSICINDRVIDFRNASGFIKDIYANSTAIIEFDDETRNTIDLQYVAREVQCLYGFCVGDRVRDAEGEIGTITDLFENGQTELAYASGEVYFTTLNDLIIIEDVPVVIVHDWPVRPYPGNIYNHYPFPEPPVAYPYPWPYMYPYELPDSSHRVVVGIFVGRPRHGEGHHEHEAYPYPVKNYPTNPNGPRPLPYPGHYPNGGTHG